MTRDFRAELCDTKCWDRHTQALLDATGEPAEACVLQNREELIGLCEVIEAANVRSYLEIGIWTGGLVSVLHQLFGFERVAACDDGYVETLGLEISVPNECRLFRGDSSSQAYQEWRAGLGHVDLVVIDANHSYGGVKRDFELNRRFPHRLLAFHDITGANRYTTGVRRFWEELDWGHKLEIVRPHPELGLETPTMGIGIWSESEPLEGL